MEGAVYQPKYSNSWALVIGIDNYSNASPLRFARADAEALTDTLITRFKFPKGNVRTLFDSDATSAEIRKEFLSFANSAKIRPDDRLIVFFAGHGHTISGVRGEVGFLVPADGDPESVESLIRWDELTRNADLIPAKHVLFLMDACYGGLALQREPSFGNMRFLGDMLQRFSRQVLTAGKADETVADGNGIRPGHSIFTAHLLNGLEGAASTKEGIITASGLMAYVYERVSRDHYSRQTPHYGFLDGDGDFIFDTTLLDVARETDPSKAPQEGGRDILINTSQEVSEMQTPVTISDIAKELLSDPIKRIKLDDFVSKQIRNFLEQVDLRNFPTQGDTVSQEAFTERVGRYEKLTSDLQRIVILLTKWGTEEHLKLLEKIFKRLAEADKGSSGFTVWLHLTWYPLNILIYAAGISALASARYDALKVILETRVIPDPNRGREPSALVCAVTNEVISINEQFKWLPGSERAYVPRSEHLFKLLQPILEDELLLGRNYEELFDQFEVFAALTYSDLENRNWGPPGRFAWKHNRSNGSSTFDRLHKEAIEAGERWAPIRAGLFQGSKDRFIEVWQAYSSLLKNLHWW